MARPFHLELEVSLTSTFASSVDRSGPTIRLHEDLCAISCYFTGVIASRTGPSNGSGSCNLNALRLKTKDVLIPNAESILRFDASLYILGRKHYRLAVDRY